MSFHRTRLVRLLFTIAAITMAVILDGAFATGGWSAETSPSNCEVQIGWKGECLIGAWTPVRVTIDLPESSLYRVNLVAQDAEGNHVEFEGEPQAAGPGPSVLWGEFVPGRIGSHLQVKVYQGDHLIWQKRFDADRGEASPFVLRRQSERIVGVVGQFPSGLVEAITARPLPVSATRLVGLSDLDLPSRALGYQSLAALIFTDPSQATERSLESIGHWLNRGGHVVIAASSASKQFNDLPLIKHLKIHALDEVARIRDTGSIENYASRLSRVSGIDGLTALRIPCPIEQVLAGSSETPQVARIPHGFGAITLLTLNSSHRSMTEWKDLGEVYRRMMIRYDRKEKEGAIRESSSLGSSGITELSSQLFAILDQRFSRPERRPWVVMAGIAIWIVVIAIIDYFLVGRWWKSPQRTWYTLPFWLLASLGLTSVFVSPSSVPVLASQWSLIDYQDTSKLVRCEQWTTIKTTNSGRSDLAVSCHLPGVESWKQSPLTSFGIPEDVFGGMYRPQGLELIATGYRVGYQGSALQDFPGWYESTRSVRTESLAEAPVLVNSQLESPGGGRLLGQFSHQLPGKLEDWIVAYNDRVYRWVGRSGEAISLAPGQIFRLEQSSVQQRQLRSFLTRTYSRRTQLAGRQEEITLQQLPYEATSLDSTEFARMLTFHGEAGGKSYTGLSNDLLDTFDLSRELRLGKAVVFGRLEGAVGRVKINGQDITPESTVHVRLILDVGVSDRPAPKAIDFEAEEEARRKAESKKPMP